MQKAYPMRRNTVYRGILLLFAFLGTVVLLLVFPLNSFASSAHAIVLRSDPADGATLRVSPTRIRLWFNETLDTSPLLSTVVVINSANQSVDRGDARVVSSDAREMDVSVQSPLPPGGYEVVWNAASQDDGHLSSGTIRFIVTRPDGSLPPQTTQPYEQSTNSSSNVTASNSSSFWFFLATTLLELTAIFWVGTQVFLRFVLAPLAKEQPNTEKLYSCVKRRFEFLVLPTLLLLFLANSAILLEQVATLAGKNQVSLWNLTLWLTVLTSGRLALFWLIREFLVLLLFRLAFVPIQIKSLPASLATILSWANLILGLLLLLTMALTSHASATRASLVVSAVVADFFHLLAAAFWIGGILCIACCYVPVLRRFPLSEQARSLVTVLPAYSSWAWTGVGFMAITGPFIATVRLQGWYPLFTTLYGQTLLLKVGLVAVLLLTSAFHLFVLRPRLQKLFLALCRIERLLGEKGAGQDEELSTIAQMKHHEQRLARSVRFLIRLLRFEAFVGTGIVLCVGLMIVFAGTLPPVP